MECSVLPFELGDGPANMALDEAMLDEAVRARDVALLRIYGWSEPALSLGYFQSVSEARADERFHGAALVRRASGGGAIWHEHEVTYAVALPPASPLSRRHEVVYDLVHEAISTVCRHRGYSLTRRGGARGGGGGRPFLCFEDRDPHDLVMGSDKLLGSAQRRRDGALLQHGSLLLRAGTRTPHLPGLHDVPGTPADREEWAREMARAIAEGLGFAADPIEVPSTLRARAEAWMHGRYLDPAWTSKR